MHDDDGHPDREHARRFVDEDIKRKGRHDDPRGKEGKSDIVSDDEATLDPPDWFKRGESAGDDDD